MSDEDYDQGFAEGYYHGLSTDKETSFLILAARIDELKKENEKLAALSAKASQEASQLRAALKPFADIAKQTEHWSGPPVSVPLYVIRSAAAALKETRDEGI